MAVIIGAVVFFCLMVALANWKDAIRNQSTTTDDPARCTPHLIETHSRKEGSNMEL